MAFRIRVKPKFPRKFRSEVFREEFRKEAGRLRQQYLRDFKLTTETWEEHDVLFRTGITSTPAELSWWVVTSDRVYKWVSQGTSIRYATMTHDFIPKTRTRVIGSGPGQGGLLFVNRNRPRPGIKAREFPDAIKTKNYRRTIFRFEVAMRNAARRSGHRYG